ncbi:nucleoside:proton symporter (partial) [Hyalomma marginatum]|uniref:Nucleoside:proton symporter (Partial) n=1 Tax=Hyalomma marginatum TaxID=34627 RepID=A0A8S4C1M3_9ACAR|nr:nucleoside:proton symporter (partial) [Hyalomma marginatum]
MGIPWEEANITGGLLGTKLITNKLVAYQEFVGGSNLSSSTKIIVVYTLCGFANIGSI